MINSSTPPYLGSLVSVAYAGTDMPVHIVCESKSGDLTSWKLNYPTFSRILRERAERKWTILLLEAFRQCQVMDANGLLRWNLIQVKTILGSGLSLDDRTASMSNPPLKCAA